MGTNVETGLYQARTTMSEAELLSIDMDKSLC